MLLTGQCGNQVGDTFWSQICSEHAISNDGTNLLSENLIKRNDRPDVFFKRNNKETFTPRAILVDMEPRVINSVTSGDKSQLFNPRNIYISKDGGGAANQWVQGYVHAKKNIESITNMIDRELDSCDNLEAFQLIHSVGGGTGSGFGSYILEELSDRYSKKLIQTYSIFGHNEIVVEPYNTILALKRLIQNSDANIVFDNYSLSQIATNNLKIESPSYKESNKLISTVMSAITNPIRFPLYSYNSITSIMSTLIPTPDLHFLTPSYTPFTSDYVNNIAKDLKRSTTYDVILELIDTRLKMSSYNEPHLTILSMMDILIQSNGNNGSNQLNNKFSDLTQKALIKARSRVDFAPWIPSIIHMAIGQRSPNVKDQQEIVSGLQLTNSSSITHLLKKVVSQYDQLMRKNAFLNNYQRSDYDVECGGDIMQEFQDSRELVETLINEYNSTSSLSYINGEEEFDGFEDPLEEVVVEDVEME